MKKKLLSVLLSSMCIFTLVACGKTEEEMASDYYQKELGLDKEDADELAKELYGDGKEDGNIDNLENDIEMSQNTFKLVEPSSKIVNSKLSDVFVQVYDVILYLDGSMTVADVLNGVDSSTDFKVTLKDDINENSLAEGDKSAQVILIDEFGEQICQLTYKNTTNEPKEIYDCIIIGFEGYDNHHLLNIFYAGNICAGTYLSAGNRDCPEYEERVKDYPVLSYTEVGEFLREQGYGYVKYDNDMYSVIVAPSEPVYTDYAGYVLYSSIEIRIGINMKDAVCSGMRYVESYGLDEYSAFSIDTLEAISEDNFHILDDYAQDKVESTIKEDVSLFGYTKGNYEDMSLVYVSESGKYCLIYNINPYIRYGGKIGYCDKNNNVITFSNLEELIDYSNSIDEVIEYSYSE